MSRPLPIDPVLREVVGTDALARNQKIVLEQLAESGTLTVDNLLLALYGDHDKAPKWAVKCVHVAVCRLRELLQPGYEIVTEGPWHAKTYRLRKTESVDAETPEAN